MQRAYILFLKEGADPGVAVDILEQYGAEVRYKISKRSILFHGTREISDIVSALNITEEVQFVHRVRI